MIPSQRRFDKEEAGKVSIMGGKGIERKNDQHYLGNCGKVFLRFLGSVYLGINQHGCAMTFVNGQIGSPQTFFKIFIPASEKKCG